MAAVTAWGIQQQRHHLGGGDRAKGKRKVDSSNWWRAVGSLLPSEYSHSVGLGPECAQRPAAWEALGIKVRCVTRVGEGGGRFGVCHA